MPLRSFSEGGQTTFFIERPRKLIKHMKDKIVTKYVAIIILSPGITQMDDGSIVFKRNGIVFNYEFEGDREFRLKAAQKLYQDGACSNFIIVGGNVDTRVNGRLQEYNYNNQSIPKSEVIKSRLVDKYMIPEGCLTCLKSTPSTEGNAIEVLRHLSEKNIQFLDKIGLLTNFYHLTRAIRIFIDISNLRLVPVAAEGVIYDEEFENIKSFYKSEGFSRVINDLRDCKSEIKGMSDREKGSYAGRSK